MNFTCKSIAPSVEALKTDFGAIYSRERSTFRLWAPAATKVQLCLFTKEEGVPVGCYDMLPVNDYYELGLEGDFDGTFYSYLVDGVETTDPFARASSVNSMRSAVVCLEDTDPEGFRQSGFSEIKAEDAVIYELHIGDFSMHSTAGTAYPGKYLSFTEDDLRFGDRTVGLAHLKELGVTHLHFMPVNDFISVNERPEYHGRDSNYNWGYDPESYFVPEGSYSTDPFLPKQRIYELKRMIQTIHDQGMAVVFDVVYNHTFKTLDSNFNLTAPGYFYRMDDRGFSNGSGVGNELATEKPMVRKMVLDSLRYWMEEYKLDGFRFDLMALIDFDSVLEIVRELRKINPNVLIYGEPWAGGHSALPWHRQTSWTKQKNNRFSLFNENFREAIRGDNDGYSRGFIQGNPAMKHRIEQGLIGSIRYDFSYDGGLENPLETVNYFNAHDNLILEDKLQLSVGPDSNLDRMTRLAFGILLTAQGIPFFHAGNEFRRTKQNNSNSYNAPYAVNAIDWSLKDRNADLVAYVRDLIKLRRDYPVLRQKGPAAIRKSIRIIQMKNPNLVTLLYRMEEGWLLCLHYNGWSSCLVSWDPILDQMVREKAIFRRIFDETGDCHADSFHIQRKNGDEIYLSPLSTTVFRLY